MSGHVMESAVVLFVTLRGAATDASVAAAIRGHPWQTTQDQMMERIKSLAVSVLHTAVHTVSLH